MDVTSLCADLVRIPSENPPGDTKDVIHYIRDFTDSLGIRTRVVKNTGGRYNLVSAGTRGNLLLCGHVDVVPALKEGWSVDPFSGRISGGYVWGRGATDMKGGVASLLWACRSVMDRGDDLPADLALVCDEETSGTYGIRCLLQKGLLRPCDCLIAEPTPALCPNIGQKGLLRINFDFRGEPGHGSLYPLRGTSAIMEAYSLLEYLKDLNMHEIDPGEGLRDIIRDSSVVLARELGMEDSGTILRRIMFNPGRIEGGEKANIVAQRCSLELDIRVPWGCATGNLVDDLKAHAPQADVKVVSESDPSFTSPESRIVKYALAGIEREYGEKAHPVVQWAASDARYLRKEGFSVIEYGPGEISLLHGIDERVAVDSLERASRVYERIISSYPAKKT